MPHLLRVLFVGPAQLPLMESVLRVNQARLQRHMGKHRVTCVLRIHELTTMVPVGVSGVVFLVMTSWNAIIVDIRKMLTLLYHHTAASVR
jgi:hypothetical protein